MIDYSIIIPHYNIPNLLSRCLKSIPQRDDIQVIVVDDNSPGNENYFDTVPELSASNVEFYVTKEGKGAGHVRNVGLEHAVGKWLIFADADDFFVDDFSEILDRFVNDTHDIIFFNINSCDCYDIGKRFPSKKDRLFEEFEKSGSELVFRIGGTEPWGKIIRRAIVVDNAISFQETRGHNDLLFSVVSGVMARSIAVVNRPMYWYVIREGSLGHQKGVEPMEKVRDRITAWKSAQDFLSGKGIKTRLYLPAIPCIRTLKKSPFSYPQLMREARRIGCNSWSITCGIIRYYTKKYFCGQDGLCIDQQIVK